MRRSAETNSGVVLASILRISDIILDFVFPFSNHESLVLLVAAALTKRRTLRLLLTMNSPSSQVKGPLKMVDRHNENCSKDSLASERSDFMFYAHVSRDSLATLTNWKVEFV